MTKTMTTYDRMLILCSLAWALLAVSAPAIAAPPAIDLTHDGTVVGITSDKLVMKSNDGKEHTHTLSADAKLTLDGMACKSADLKPGTKIRVTTKAENKGQAIRVEAVAKNKKFTSVLTDGIILNLTGDRLAMAGTRGAEEYTRTLTKDVKITCDGKACTAADLKPGMVIRVTSQSDAPLEATQVDALSKDLKFPSLRHDGTVVSVAGNELSMVGAPGRDQHTCTFTADVKVTRDGTDCKPSDLKPGMRVRVTTQSDNPHAAMKIEALDKNLKFASP